MPFDYERHVHRLEGTKPKRGRPRLGQNRKVARTYDVNAGLREPLNEMAAAFNITRCALTRRILESVIKRPDALINKLNTQTYGPIPRYPLTINAPIEVHEEIKNIALRAGGYRALNAVNTALTMAVTQYLKAKAARLTSEVND